MAVDGMEDIDQVLQQAHEAYTAKSYEAAVQMYSQVAEA